MSVLLSTAIAGAFIGFSPSAATITANIPCAGRLQLSEPNASVLTAGRSTRIRVRNQGRESLRLLMVVRTNCPYHIDAALQNPAVESIGIAEVSSGPYAGTAHLRRGALTGGGTASVIHSAPTTIWRGPEISRGGNDSTPDNALLIRCVLNMPANADDFEVVISFWLDGSR